MPTGVYERTPEMNYNNSRSRKGVSKSTETCDAMSKAHKGTHHSPEHCAALVKGQEESGMFDKMRGGNDIVNHHYIYDHSDLSKYTMKMTRSRHTWLHWVMRASGIIVPHINIED